MSTHCVSRNAWIILVFTLLRIEDISEACLFRTSFSANQNKKVQSQEEHEFVLDKDIVSVVEQTLIKTLIEMGKLKFHCPRDDGFYADMLDCRKYYKCTNSTFSTHQCETGTGFEPQAKSCVQSESVTLCQRVQKLEGFQCNATTGLQTFSDDCKKFILCTEESAFTSSCNRGDLFDQKLKLCLPEQDAFCNLKVNQTVHADNLNAI